jgi:hypothetical protein
VKKKFRDSIGITKEMMLPSLPAAYHRHRVHLWFATSVLDCDVGVLIAHSLSQVFLVDCFLVGCVLSLDS